jgi:1-acyl-sn-glycerol-3-phosphate acyltransferase
MRLEGFEQHQQTPEEGAHKETPARFRLAVETMLKASFSAIEVVGEENLKKLPPGAKVIIATTHISDYDVIMPIAKLGKQFKIKAVNASVQHSFLKDPLTYTAAHIAGIENTIPVDIQFAKHETAGRSYVPSPFNPENFVPMRQALDEGDAIVMAAYTPPPVKDGMLGKKAGFGAVYLAEISGAYILPVAVNIKSDDPKMGTKKSPFSAFLNRPEAEMIIGEPIPPREHPVEAQDLTPRTMREALRDRSDALMYSLAELLPEEKRGVWDKR